MFPDLPRIDFQEGERQSIAEFDPHWSSFKPIDLAFRPADGDLDLLTQQQFQTSSKHRYGYPQSGYNGFPSWTVELSRAHERIHPSPSHEDGFHALPYNLSIPRDASPDGWWRPAAEDSCSGGSTWSPRTSEGRLETDAASAGRLSSAHFLSNVSYPEYGGYQSPRVSVIAPCKTQLYPDVAHEDHPCIKPLPELDTAYFNALEGPGVLQSQRETTTPDDETSSMPAEEEDDEIMEDIQDEDLSDYTPHNHKRSHRRINSRQPISPLTKRPTRASKTPTLSKPSKITKRPTKPLAPIPSPTSPLSAKAGKTPCPHCPKFFQSLSALSKHTLASHTRPFVCSFSRYGCPSTFGSKNEWKRHVSSQHLRLGIYRCDIGACVPVSTTTTTTHRRKSSSSSRTGTGHAHAISDPSAVYNEFNRKDLFTQHVRRMHGPPVSASRADKDAFDASLEAVRTRCWIALRNSPPRSICGFCPTTSHSPSSSPPTPTTSSSSTTTTTTTTPGPPHAPSFVGATGWDERMEHVGKHLERGEDAEREDDGLRIWMVDEGLLKRCGDGGWRVVGCGGRRRGRAGAGTGEGRIGREGGAEAEAEVGEEEDGEGDDE